MAYYQIYVLNERGRAVEGYSAKCSTDDAVCELAERGLPENVQAEIWTDSRRVGRVPRSVAALWWPKMPIVA